MGKLIKYEQAEVYMSHDVDSGLFTVEEHDVYLAADVDLMRTQALELADLVIADFDSGGVEYQAAQRFREEFGP